MWIPLAPLAVGPLLAKRLAVLSPRPIIATGAWRLPWPLSSLYLLGTTATVAIAVYLSSAAGTHCFGTIPGFIGGTDSKSVAL